MPAEMVSSLLDDTVGAAEDTMVLWPGDRALTDNADRRAVLFAHGHTGQENTPDYLRADCLMLVRAGFTVISGDFGGPSEWGNDNAIAAVAATLAHARAEGWCSADPVITIGFSMGNLTCLNWTRANMADSAGHIAVCGAFDLTALHAGTYTSQIDTAYGGYSEATHGAEHNPVTYASTISSIPIVTFYSEGDTTTPAEHEWSFASFHGNTTRNADPTNSEHGMVPYVWDIGYLADAALSLVAA